MKNNKIKVLHLIAGLGNGGAERQLFELLKENKDHLLCSFSDSGVYEKKIKNIGINLITFKVKYSVLIFFKIIKIIKIIKSNNINTIHAWMYNSCIISIFLKLFLRKRKINILWAIRCSNMNVTYYSLKLRLNIFFCKIFSSLADKIIYNSYAGFRYHNKIGFNAKNAIVIQNGVDDKKFNFCIDTRKKLRKKFNLFNDDKVLLCVARVDPMKGHSVLLNAFSFAVKQHKNLKLCLIGKGTEKFNKLENVLVLGMIGDIESYYSMADFIILPSLFGEGFSNVLVEGMLSKLFPISTDVGDNKLIIGESGIIFSPNNMKLAIDTLEKISNMQQKEIKDISSKAFLRAKNKFSIKKMSNSYKKIYKEIF